MKERIDCKNFIHNDNSKISNNIREIIFGVEDGVVSTLGALTGIAIATNNPFTVVISGIVIISVESISMGMGSYLSNQSVHEVKDRKLQEESLEIEEFLEKEKEELFVFFCQDGWPEKLAREMAETASKNKDLMLKEMAFRELLLIPNKFQNSFHNGLIMFCSYVIGGIVPLFPYFFLPISKAIFLSIFFAILGLFILGATTSKFTFTQWWKNGLRILLLGGISTIVGLVIGQLANYFK